MWNIARPEVIAMPHQPLPPDGTPFFARIDKFHCECPHCSDIILVTGRNRRDRRKRKPDLGKPGLYNALASILTCPACGHHFGVGLLLWNLTSSRRAIPSDQIPTRRQLALLRHKAAGVWPHKVKRAGEPTNVAAGAECTCPDEGWAPACPIHRWAWGEGRPAEEPEG